MFGKYDSEHGGGGGGSAVTAVEWAIYSLISFVTLKYVEKAYI